MSTFTKITYVTLFVGLLLMPHFSTHLGPIPRNYVESLVTLILFWIAYAAYLLHNRELERQRQRILEAEEHSRISEKKLVESFEYIGKVNRKLPLLKSLSSDLLIENKPTKKSRGKILHTLLATAVVSIASANWGLFRFVEVATGRTTREVVHTAKSYLLLKYPVRNADLVKSRAHQGKWKENRDFYIVPLSDLNAPVQVFLVLPKSSPRVSDEYPLLQAITDQAQLFYKYLFV